MDLFNLFNASGSVASNDTEVTPIASEPVNANEGSGGCIIA
jgi:hypothetical protein